MVIQLNSDNNLVLHTEYREKLQDLLHNELGRFDNLISRLELHLSDENGVRQGVTDKRCLLEAREEGKQPVAVSEVAETYDKAIAGAVNKLKALLTTNKSKLMSKRMRK